MIIIHYSGLSLYIDTNNPNNGSFSIRYCGSRPVNVNMTSFDTILWKIFEKQTKTLK